MRVIVLDIFDSTSGYKIFGRIILNTFDNVTKYISQDLMRHTNEICSIFGEAINIPIQAKKTPYQKTQNKLRI